MTTPGELTDEQTTAIGLVGELLAFRWLEAVYPAETTPDSWVSGNRTVVLGGHSGNDRLGYDFRIARKSGTLMLEVKTATTDDFVFDISDRELAAAKAARRGRCRIIFIREVLSPSTRRLRVLPSPLETDACRPAAGAARATLSRCW